MLENILIVTYIFYYFKIRIKCKTSSSGVISLNCILNIMVILEKSISGALLKKGLKLVISKFSVYFIAQNKLCYISLPLDAIQFSVNIAVTSYKFLHFPKWITILLSILCLNDNLVLLLIFFSLCFALLILPWILGITSSVLHHSWLFIIVN